MNTKLFVALVTVTSLTILGVSACATEPEVASVVEDTPMEAPGAPPRLLARMRRSWMPTVMC